ncbi:transposase [Streptomyces goshikiensis]|uniref:transposase n=1 Tax=Streptomyces goshikiensis TaxID=1942 RepID=UPI0036653DFD
MPALKAIYTAPDRGGRRAGLDVLEPSELCEGYPAIVRTWRSAWPQFTPYLASPPAMRTVIYSTSMVEWVNPACARHPQLRPFPPRNRPR